MPPIVTLTTDFGLSDPFVGVMKGVMLSINPSITLVDITHEINPQDVRQAVYVIGSAFEYFPKGTIHLCVVDPGVGSERKAVAFEAGGQYFIGPDNGVFTEVLRRTKVSASHEITNPSVILPNQSATFHGRDVFAPAAAHLAKGTPLNSFGPPAENLMSMDLPWEMRPAPDLVVGEVIYIDHFGNAITNITRSLVERAAREMDGAQVRIGFENGAIDGVLSNYSEADEEMSACAVFGSWDTLEIFVRNGDAAFIHGLEVGDEVQIRFS
ncbi:MAG: SAM-dependent chlorinase/fluorinase [Nitrospinae bacterium]|nr:SAM-dependent chlorinase/fluorinase [Nitrospinota bacterium]